MTGPAFGFWDLSGSRSILKAGSGTTMFVGEGRCNIVDTWWQTETGGIMITPLPGATPAKPGSATFPFFGIQPVLLTEEGAEVEGNDVSGTARN